MMQTLVGLIRRLTGLKDEENEEECRQVTDTMLKEQLNTSLEEILQIPVSDIVDFIVKRKGIHISNTDLFAEVLVLNASAEDDPMVKKELLIRGLELLEWSDKTSGIFSVDRHEKIIHIKAILKETNKS